MVSGELTREIVRVAFVVEEATLSAVVADETRFGHRDPNDRIVLFYQFLDIGRHHESVIDDITPLLFGERSERVPLEGIIQVTLHLLNLVFLEVLPHSEQGITREEIGATELISLLAHHADGFPLAHGENLHPLEAVEHELSLEGKVMNENRETAIVMGDSVVLPKRGKEV